MPTIANNKKAYFDYHVLSSYQAGLSLSGKMVKQLRSHRVNITGNYIVWQKNRLEIIGFGNDSIRENVALLLNKREVATIAQQIQQKGISCTVLNIKTIGRWLKAEIGLVKGKKNYDKRETIKKRDLDRDMRRETL